MTLYTLDGDGPVFDTPNHWIAPGAQVIGKVRLCDQASVWFGAVLRGDTDWLTIGEGSNVQDGSVLHTDPGLELRIGADVTIGHMVMLHGCEIGDNTLIGIGSVILNRVKIGKNCLIGARSFIPEGKVIPDNSFVLGSPAQVVKPVSDAHIAMIKGSAAVYRRNWQRFRDGLIALQEGT